MVVQAACLVPRRRYFTTVHRFGVTWSERKSSLDPSFFTRPKGMDCESLRESHAETRQQSPRQFICGLGFHIRPQLFVIFFLFFFFIFFFIIIQFFTGRSLTLLSVLLFFLHFNHIELIITVIIIVVIILTRFILALFTIHILQYENAN